MISKILFVLMMLLFWVSAGTLAGALLLAWPLDGLAPCVTVAALIGSVCCGVTSFVLEALSK